MSVASPPKAVWLLHGMKRSGNHALVNWLLPQLRCAFVNNAIPLGPILRGRPFPPMRPFMDWWVDAGSRRSEAARSEAASVLVTMEDHQLATMPFDPTRVDVRRLLILRRPEQLFSSRLRKASRVDMPAYPRSNDEVMRRAVSIWQEHARCYLGEECAAYPGRIAILFDAWFADGDYRAAISAAIGVDFDDSGFGQVGDEGGGSSFDGTAYDGRAQLMNVNDRLSQLESHERAILDELFSAPELQRLSEKVRQADPYRLLQIAG